MLRIFLLLITLVFSLALSSAVLADVPDGHVAADAMVVPVGPPKPTLDASIAGAVGTAVVTKQNDGGTTVVVQLPALPISPEALQDPGMILGFIKKAVQEKNYTLLSGLLLLAVVWLYRAFKPDLPVKYIRAITIVGSVTPGVVASISMGLPWDQSAMTSLMTYLLANGGWSGAVEPAKKGIKRRQEKKEADKLAADEDKTPVDPPKEPTK